MNGTTRVVLIQGCGSGIGHAVTHELSGRGVTVALHDAGRPADTAALAAELNSTGRVIDISDMPLDDGDILLNLDRIATRCGRLDALVNLFTPTAATTPAELYGYAQAMYQRGLAAGEVIARHTDNGVIVNQFYLASLFADTALAAPVSMARGALTSATRLLCVRYGKVGVRVVGLLVGLLASPETDALLSERVRAFTPPLPRWIEPVDVAKSVAFLVLDAGYISGQMLIMDCGMTSGINGT